MNIFQTIVLNTLTCISICLGLYKAREVTMLVLSETQLRICFKLWRGGCFGHGHLLIDNLIGGFPAHLQSEAKGALDQLIRKKIVRSKPTSHGYAVYINLEYRKDIENELRKKYSFL